MDANDLLPWGAMEDDILDQLKQEVAPAAWRLPNGAMPNQSDWEKWRDTLVAELEHLQLWPSYDSYRQKWNIIQGSPSSVNALLDADFGLLKILRDNLKKPISGLGNPLGLHSEFFDLEDNPSIAFGAKYEQYDPGLPPYLIQQIPDILWTGCSRRVGGLHFQLKARFQRPRPYQVALVQKRPYTYTWAQTGGTPSFVSGHCLQGALAGCSAFSAFGASLDVVSVEQLQQLTVDIGDRRVFAGIHYPSDNLGSWLSALRILPYVFDPAILRRVTKFLLEAILLRSVVFAEIKKHVTTQLEQSPYSKAVSAIESFSKNYA